MGYHVTGLTIHMEKLCITENTSEDSHGIFFMEWEYEPCSITIKKKNKIKQHRFKAYFITTQE